MSIIDSKFIRKYTYAIYGGKENLHQQVSPEDIHKIDFKKLKHYVMLRETYIPVEQNYFMMFLVISWITTSKQVIKRKKKLKQNYVKTRGVSP